MISKPNVFLFSESLFHLLPCTICVNNPSVICDINKEGLRHYMIVRCGRLHYYIGSKRKFRRGQCPFCIREHFSYPVFILLTVFHRYQPCAIPVCPTLQFPFINRCRLLTGKIIIIKFPDVRTAPGGPVFRLYLSITDSCQF